MDVKLKFFIAICTVALTAVYSMSEVKVTAPRANFTTNTIPPPADPVKGCYGSGVCGITSNGTILVGHWRE